MLRDLARQRLADELLTLGYDPVVVRRVLAWEDARRSLWDCPLLLWPDNELAEAILFSGSLLEEWEDGLRRGVRVAQRRAG